MADSKALAVRKDMKASLIHAGYSVIKDLQKHIKLWWDGSITARECAKKCAESCKIGVVELAEAGAGYKVGGIIGGVIGTMCGGTLGGMIGNAIGGAVGGAVDDANDWLVGEIFGSNKKVDLKNAYSFLGVSNGASMDAVNKAYKKKALEHHPDKGGNTDDFVKLHTCIALIKISKGCE